MKIGISNDHSAVELKMAIMDYLSKKDNIIKKIVIFHKRENVYW